MKQYNLDFYDEDGKYPCTYIREHSTVLFEGFYLENSIGMYDDFRKVATILGYMSQLEMWLPSWDERRMPN